MFTEILYGLYSSKILNKKGTDPQAGLCLCCLDATMSGFFASRPINDACIKQPNMVLSVLNGVFFFRIDVSGCQGK